MDTESVYTLSVFPGASDGLGEPRVETQAKFREFILVFQLDGTYIYRDQIRANVLVGQYFCDVDIGHLILYDEELAHQLTTNPTEMISLFEAALRQCTQRIVYPQQPSVSLPQHQLLLHSSIANTSIRDLNATAVEHLVRIPGIVIGASAPCTKAKLLVIQCRSCAYVDNVAVDVGISSVSLPRTCGRPKVPGQQDSNEPCPLDPYFVLHEKSVFVNQQMLKLQEAPDQVPVGELPRHILISADRYLANRVIPGNRCTVMAVFSTYQAQKSGSGSKAGAAVAIRAPYLRCVGITTDSSHLSTSALSFTDAEIQEFDQMSRLPDLYGRFARCVAPSIYGNLDIKKAIACLLMGGSKKILPDGMRLRGDINVLLLGDPGTAKSQLLKFVEKVSPIAIYTSGKGSSAAGLTASVQRDVTTREFYLEGGAMVLADGGVVCIDEFDKMRDEDRVAIHEAMEQQTISIAKAGITTILNARTSVLAAANPIFGRYDDLKSPGENIDFQTTILSRFDMIFIVRDDHDRARDERIAKHVMSIHMGGKGALAAEANDPDASIDTEFDVEKMRRYIAFCKSRCAPRLSLAASEKLSSHFVSIRNRVAQSERTANARSSIPITIRQLEAIIRITESLAKLTLSPVADESHVDEAIRLFLASTMDAVAQGDGAASAQLGAGARNRELQEEVSRLSDELLKRLPIGWSTGLGTLQREFVTGRGYSDASLERALYVLQRRDTLRIRGGTAGGQKPCFNSIPGVVIDPGIDIVSSAVSGAASSSRASSSNNILEDALQRLSDSERATLGDYILPTADDIDSALRQSLAAVTEKQRHCTEKRWTFTFAGRKVTLKDEADKVVRWLNRFKDVGDIAASADPVHAGLPWAGIRLLLEAAVSEANQMACLLVGCETALYMANRLTVYMEFLLRLPGTVSRTNFEGALTRLYACILRFLSQAIQVYKTPAVGRAFKAFWQDGEVQEFEKECDRLAIHVETEASNCDRTEKLRQDLQELENFRQLQASVNQIEIKLDLGKLPFAKGAMFDAYDADHVTCHPATRVDILRQIQDWALQPQSHLRGDVDLGASFFFKRGEGDRGSASRFFPTITRDLISKVPGLDTLVAEAIASNPLIFEKALGVQFDKLIYQPLQNVSASNCSTLVVVVDALDECEREGDIKTILDLWPRLTQITTVCLRLFLTSRPDLPILKGIKKLPVSAREHMVLQDAVPQTTIQNDISTFLKYEFSKIREEYEDDGVLSNALGQDWPEDQAIQALTDMATPLFIVAATVCRFIGDGLGNPRTRLEWILKMKNIGAMSQMEKTYLPVLQQLSTGVLNLTYLGAATVKGKTTSNVQTLVNIKKATLEGQAVNVLYELATDAKVLIMMSATTACAARSMTSASMPVIISLDLEGRKGNAETLENSLMSDVTGSAAANPINVSNAKSNTICFIVLWSTRRGRPQNGSASISPVAAIHLQTHLSTQYPITGPGKLGTISGVNIRPAPSESQPSVLLPSVSTLSGLLSRIHLYPFLPPLTSTSVEQSSPRHLFLHNQQPHYNIHANDFKRHFKHGIIPARLYTAPPNNGATSTPNEYDTATYPIINPEFFSSIVSTSSAIATVHTTAADPSCNSLPTISCNRPPKT
ncbi:hypothetical protein DV736_g1283, partial [Chaetothyriales sp. CBS 134916]